jgi:ectoine hydroxylase-related dioxygenase (phytanoyl-CoA dioxygenase family)
VMSAVEDYKKQGYAIIRGFYPAEVVNAYQRYLQNELATTVASLFAKWNISLEDRGCADKVDQLLKSGMELTHAERHVLLGHFPLESRLNDAINPVGEFLGSSKLLQEILDSETLYMHMPPMPRFVPPGYARAGVPPHQDLSYNRHMSDFITVWTPFVPIDEQCGGLVVFEGSKDLPEPEHVKEHMSKEPSWLPPIDVTPYERKQLIGLKPGDAVLLSPGIVHGSAANTSDRIRLSIDIRMFGEGATSTKHNLNLRTMQVQERKAA